MIFWDTSAFARCFLPDEHGHKHALNLLRRETRHAACTLLWPEATAALVRQARGPSRLLDEMLRVLSTFEIVDFGSGLCDPSVALIRRHRLRGADGAHLASAVYTWRRLGLKTFFFVTSDDMQAAAARAAGLHVLSPGA